MSVAFESKLSRAKPPILILGVPFDNVTTKEAAELIHQMVISRRPHHLVTANVDFLVQAQFDVELRRILCDAHLVLCDGTPLVWASRLLGNPLPERVAGSDLVPLLIRIASEKDFRLFFLGGTPESTALALANVKAKFPKLRVAGYSPPFNSLLNMDHEEIKRRIIEAAPDILFVSFGCPKQEKWIAMHYQSLGVPVAAGVGATIDFLAGELKRAPVWMQRTGTEWLFRMFQEPRRLFRRYVKDLRVFGWSILAQWWRLQSHRSGREQPQFSSVVETDANWQWIQLPERFDLASVRNDALLQDQILAGCLHCLLQMSNVAFIDSTGVGWLTRLQKKLQAMGRQLVLLDPSPAVKRALSLMRLQDFFASAPDLASARILIQIRILERKQAVSENLTNLLESLVWQGEITVANAEHVWRLTENQITSSSVLAQRLVLDLSHVRFIDSTGLKLMLRARNLVQRRGATLCFAGAQPAVRNVLRLARLESFLLGEPT